MTTLPSRKIILSLTISLDGYIEGPGGEIDWISATEETGRALLEFARGIDTVLYGRKSYELYGNYLPEAGDPMYAFYREVNGMKKYVFSKTAKPDGQAVLISDDIPSAVRELRNQPGKNIWLFGGADLITTFVNHNLIDEYIIAVQPVIIGAGNPLFKNIRRYVHLKLAGTRTPESGVVELRYERVETGGEERYGN